MRVSSVVASLAMTLGCSDKPPPAVPPPVPVELTPAPPTPADAAAAPSAPDDRMGAVSKLYDRMEYAGAAVGAEAILRDEPDNVRMLRVAISSYCALRDGTDRAQQLWRRLPRRDQDDMIRRCDLYGITLR